MPILTNARYERFTQIVVDGQLTSLPRDFWGGCQRPGCEFLPTDEKATDCRADPRIESGSFGAMRPVAQEIQATAISFPAREGLLRTQSDRQPKAGAGKDFVRSDKAR
jgi:hypothetical protein